MKKTIIILSLLAVIVMAGGCGTSRSVVSHKKNIVGMWHFPKDRYIIEITPTHIFSYGEESPMLEYELLNKRKLMVVKQNREHTTEYTLSKDGNKFMLIDSGQNIMVKGLQYRRIVHLSEDM